MKEVTRIHIAKVSYDIEITAKKKLESYIEDLSVYAEDANVLEDIEIRITELLEKRGVTANGVVTVEDVEFIRKTLGEPQDFSAEGDIAVGPDEEKTDRAQRKLFRDIDGAVLGGVLSGLAQFLKVNVLWVRLAFLLVLFISFGFAALLYIVLWAAVPAAKTVTQKLQMRGEPATVGNIRKYNESQVGMVSTKERLRLRRQVFGVIGGVIGLLVALGAGAVTVFGSIAWLQFVREEWVAFGLYIASGALLAVLGVLIAYSGFAAKITKRGLIAGFAVVLLGLLTFGTATGITGINAWQQDQTLRQSIKERGVTLPEKFADAKTLVVDAVNIQVEYRVSEDVRASLMALPGTQAIITQEGANVKVTVGVARDADSMRYPPSLTIYGPKLDSLEVKNGAVQYTAKSQELRVTAAGSGSVMLFGNFSQLQADIKESGNLGAEGASVRDAVLTMDARTSVSLGNLEVLTATQPTACPNNGRAQLWVESIADRLTYNGENVSKTTQDRPCGAVFIGQNDTFYSSRSY